MQRMSLSQAVRNALEAERAAEGFYRMLSDSTDDAAARELLEALAEQESEHQARIRELAEQLNAGTLPARPDDQVEVIETAPAWTDVDEISFETALEIALENEHHAAAFYDALRDASEGAVAAFFAALVEDETRHADALRARLESRDPDE